MIPTRKVVCLLCAVLLLPFGVVKAQDSGPSMQETKAYLVKHINAAGGTWWYTPDYHEQNNIEFKYHCVALTDGLYLTQDWYTRTYDHLDRVSKVSITLNFRDVILNRSEVGQQDTHGQLESPKCYLEVHYKSSTKDDTTWYIWFTNTDEARRVGKALEHAATLAGAQRDPFDN